MAFNPNSKAEPFISVSVDNPPKPSLSETEEPIAELRKRLSHEWRDYVRSGTGNHSFSGDGDSFCRWCEEASEGAIRTYEKNRIEFEEEQKQARMRESVETANRLLYELGSGGEHKISMSELQNSPAYQKLSAADQFTCRYFVENCQQQTPEGWVLRWSQEVGEKR